MLLEIVAFDRQTHRIRSFQTLTSRKRKDVTLEELHQRDENTVCLFLFDVMYWNGKSTIEVSLRDRRTLLASLLLPSHDSNEISIADSICTSDEEEMETFFRKALDANCEGIMVKQLDGSPASQYEPNKRSLYWVKVLSICYFTVS